MQEMSILMGLLLLVLIRSRVKIRECLSKEVWIKCWEEEVKEQRAYDT